KAGIRAAELIDPAHFRSEPDDLPQRIESAENEHAQNEAVQPRIGEEGRFDLGKENGCDEARKKNEEHHPCQIDAGLGKTDAFLFCLCHESFPFPWFSDAQPPKRVISTRSCGPLSRTPPNART